MAAGLGFKTFNTGDVLSAADVNGYLMQGVWVFANATARNSAVTAPVEGNACYLSDTNDFQIYSGTAWVSYGAGDITGVTAGIGISGGGTSGDVTITNSMATAIDAKGDLIVGTGADAFARLAVGATNNHVLTVDSATSTGMKWAAVSAGGMTLLGSGTLSGSTVTLSSISNTYTNLVIFLNGIVQSTTARCSIRLNNSTSNANTTNIYSTGIGFNDYLSSIPVASSDSTYFMNSTGHNAFAYEITNYAATVRKAYRGFGGYKYSTDTNQIPFHVYGSTSDTVAYDRIDIVTSSGTFSSGNYAIYGVR